MLRRDMIIFLGFFLLTSLIALNINPALARMPMIAFLSNRTGDQEVYILFGDGETEQITKNKARALDPEWSPDGKTIIFACNIRGGEAFDFLTKDVTDLRSKQTDLTKGEFGKMTKPRWAPAGSPRILTESTALPNPDNWDIGMLDLSEKPPTIFNISNVGGQGVGQDLEASWSPDGTKVAFHSERAGSFDIFIADMTTDKPGVNQVQLTKDPASDQRARWSPDGTKIVFESKRDGDWEIFVIDIDGQNLKQLTDNDKTDRNADWSETGIVFESNRDGNYEIYRMDADGNNQVNLTNDKGKDSKPLWSPNGAKILFESRRDKNTELYIMDADGSNVKNLTNNPAKDFSGKWNPVYFMFPVEPKRKQFTTLGEVKRTTLLQNYPNPFNPETWIPYHLVNEAFVTVRIYNLKGELVRSFETRKQPAGAYLNREKAVYWDGRNNLGQAVASGVYFYQLLTDRFSQTRRMLMVK
ncbi:TPA: T9SS type A sorting domain-containing protein [Candidatus Poribacteria bacterium]|nr:T9SS type A sorting domain-containing protein [Candidatus Poribacteria bacterium]